MNTKHYKTRRGRRFAGHVLRLVLPAGMLLAAGCAKEAPVNPPEEDLVELGFRISALSEPQPWTGTAVRSADFSRATGEEAMPAGAEVLVRVFPVRDGTPDYTAPQARSVYRVSASGEAEPVGEADRISLRAGTYAFDFVYPADTEKKPGGSIEVTNGTDFMAVTRKENVVPDESGNCTMDVRLARLCSQIHISISPKAVAVGPLTLAGENASLSGLAEEAIYKAGSGTLTVTGMDGSIGIAPSSFVTEGNALVARNIIVLPLADGNARDLKFGVKLDIDGRETDMAATLSGVELGAGSERLFDLSVN